MIPAPVILIIACCVASSCTSRNSIQKEHPKFKGETLSSVQDTNTVKRYKWEVFYRELTENERHIIDSVTQDPFWIVWDFENNCTCDSTNTHKLFFPTRNKETVHSEEDENKFFKVIR